ncbi:glycosyltransferase family 4 protein [Spirochaeta cellobiosiphila]|uniref:glycosyltransferase family 4 protein n=1 Tax=Spirochaeta cellobiosiphila TaxID=504483 RepID=UPI0003F5EF0E|nr:glycosyltransferase family 4 protein [Spirochaeta cellobiosiphila]
MQGKVKNIGFISTRLQGTDGVTLETAKWVTILEKNGYNCFFFAGQSDWDKEKTMVCPEAFFDHPTIKELQKECFGKQKRPSQLTGEIHHLRLLLKEALYEFITTFAIDLIIPENALTIPMNIPLGTAITELIAETGIPTIAHHHDFYWERQRFMVNCVPDFLSMAFPPTLPSIRHVVINTPADQQLSFRTGLSAMVIPNVIDFNSEPPGIDDFTKHFREDLGIKDDDLLILQPTRVVARKGIEHAIEIVARLNNPKAKLVITHEAGDEGYSYQKRIESYAQIMGVDLILKPDLIGKVRGYTKDKKRVYSLWDAYPHADIVTYPSTYEGFGNALLEAIWFQKPLLVNRYSIYEMDIEPLGFDVVAMDGYVTDQVVEDFRTVLEDKKTAQKMGKRNLEIAQRYFSYEVLEYKLKTLLLQIEGLDQTRLT